MVYIILVQGFVHFGKIKITQSSGELRLKLNINFLMLS